QVNYTIRMKSEFSGDPITFYNQLQKGQAAKYTAYLNVDNYSILSASPELFFQLHNKNIITKPMAGTVARGKTFEEDDDHAKWLERSSKNRNENEQIIQLMKQDLAKIAKSCFINWIICSFSLRFFDDRSSHLAWASSSSNEQIIQL